MHNAQKQQLRGIGGMNAGSVTWRILSLLLSQQVAMQYSCLI